MSFTRFHDDPNRIEKQAQESTDPGRYMLNVPGNGSKPSFIDDPYIRMEKWGANRRTNFVNLESDLKGLTRMQNRDCLDTNNYKDHSTTSKEVKYPIHPSITEQPRATHPAWTVRDLEQVNWQILHLDPREKACIPFNTNISTRIVEKQNFVAFPNNENIN